MLIRQRKPDDALRLAEQMQITSKLPEHACDARILRADALASRGDTVQARDELEGAISEHPGNRELLERLCRLLFEHFPPIESEPALRHLIARDPQNTNGHHNLGTILHKLGRFEESASAYRRSLELRHDSASTFLHLGYALREAGKFSDAAAAWHEARRLGQTIPP